MNKFTIEFGGKIYNVESQYNPGTEQNEVTIYRNKVYVAGYSCRLPVSTIVEIFKEEFYYLSGE